MRKVPALLSPEEIDRIASLQSYPKYRMMIRLLFALAIRVGELTAIRLTDINLKAATIIIQGKGSKQRILPLTAMQCHQLEVFLLIYSPKKWLFENCDGNAYTTHGIYNIVRDAAAKAGIKSHPHALRHSRATDLINKHVGLWHVQQLLGHSSIQTTTVYLHYAVGDLRKAIS